MKPLIAPPDIKQQILLSAIELFAEQGIEATSLRMINREIGAKNMSAVHYHFGSKEGLIEAAILFIQDWFENARESELLKLELKSKSDRPEIREVLSIFARPYLLIMQKEYWGYSAVRFIAKAKFESSSVTRKAQLKHAESFVIRLSNLAKQSLPQIPEGVLMYRLNYAAASLIQHLSNSGLEKNGWFHDDFYASDALLDLYLDYNVAGMSAPLVTQENSKPSIEKSAEQMKLLI